MEDKFVETINYLKKLKYEFENEELTNDEKLLIIIKNAILNDRFYEGSIILTKENDIYRVSDIQKHHYGWLLKNKIINLDEIINKLDDLNITYSIKYYQVSDHKNDYELLFGVPSLNNYKKKTRTIK